MHSQLHHLVADAAARWPDAPAISCKRDTLSYSGLWTNARAVAAGLLRAGLKRGDRVAVYLEKRFENVSSIFGVSAASGVFVPINPILRQKQVSYILDNCSCRVLITTPERLELLREELNSCPALELIIVTGSEPAELSGVKTLTWEDLLRDAVFDAQVGGVVDADIAAILYTSGSTGKPKGVVVSHRNLLVGAESVSSYLENRPSDVIMSVLPLSFDAGFSQLTTAFNVGAHVVLVNYLMPEEVVRAVCATQSNRHHRSPAPVDAVGREILA